MYELQLKFGKLPATRKVQTGGGGTHFYFKHPGGHIPNSSGQIGPGVDIRGDGGYVLAPPSVTDGPYQTLHGDAAIEAPAWLLERLKHGAHPVFGEKTYKQPVFVEGERNNGLTSLAGSLRRAGLAEAELRAALLQANAGRCDPQLSVDEVETIAKSVSRYAPPPEAEILLGNERKPEKRKQADLSWPILDGDALYGLAGDFVRTIEPHSEADPVGILIQFLVAFGSAVGRGPHFLVEADEHHLNLFAVLVGATSKGRKGTALGHVLRAMNEVDPSWKDHRASGMSSGEGLIWAVRDPITKFDPKEGEEEIADQGVSDKRLFVVESELASTLRVLAREGNTLSPILREAWDRGDLQSLVKNFPARATGAHVSVIGHITRDELLRFLDRTECANGFANRFLWVCVKRSKCLPDGGDLDLSSLLSLISRVQVAVDFARGRGRMCWSGDAHSLWCEIYWALSEGEPGLFGAVISRAEAQVIRLATVYALLDSSPVIKIQHLRAALALWSYCDQSCKYIFGDALGHPVADRILQALRNQPNGLTRSQISDLFGRHASGGEIGLALRFLAEHGRAKPTSEESGGRPIERWRAVAKEAKKVTSTTTYGENGDPGGLSSATPERSAQAPRNTTENTKTQQSTASVPPPPALATSCPCAECTQSGPTGWLFDSRPSPPPASASPSPGITSMIKSARALLPLAGGEAEAETRQAALRWVNTDRAEARRLRGLGQFEEAKKLEESAAEAEKRAAAL